MKKIFERRLRIPAPASQVFAWHEQDSALEKLIPPGDPVKVLEHSGGIRDGAQVVLLVGRFPFQIKWVARHDNFVEGRQFRDVQVSGPFRTWEHTHSVMPDGPDASILIDHVEYELPFGAIGGRLLDKIVMRKLNKMFDWRHNVTHQAFART